MFVTLKTFSMCYLLFYHCPFGGRINTLPKMGSDVNIDVLKCIKRKMLDFPGGAVVKNPPANAGARVQALVPEDPTCHGATKPMCYSY